MIVNPLPIRVAVSLIVGLGTVSLIAIALPGCDGNTAASADGAVDGDSGSGSGGHNGGGGMDAGGTGGAAPGPKCPATPPGPSSSCSPSGFQCYYEDCAGAGRTLATCTGGTWNVETGACAIVRCNANPIDMTCAAGQICVVLQGGAIFAMCAANPCGPAPLGPDCLSASYAGCSVRQSITDGVTIICSSCPTLTCA